MFLGNKECTSVNEKIGRLGGGGVRERGRITANGRKKETSAAVVSSLTKGTTS